MPYAAPRIAQVPAARPDPRQRLLAMLLSAAFVALIGWLLLLGLAPGVIARAAERITQVSLLPVPPPPPERPKPPEQRKAPVQQTHARKPAEAKRKPAAAAPPNLRAQATPVVAPKPIIPVRVPPPVVVAPVAHTGAQASQGAAEIAGPGTGAGGQGNGFGAGGDGDGDGGGGGGGGGSGVIQISRDLKESDVPCLRHDACEGGDVGMRITIGLDGRVTRCIIVEPSGDPDLDAQTCAAAQAHLRFRPATDRTGRPIVYTGRADQYWHKRRPRPEDDDDRY